MYKNIAKRILRIFFMCIACWTLLLPFRPLISLVSSCFVDDPELRSTNREYLKIVLVFTSPIWFAFLRALNGH